MPAKVRKTTLPKKEPDHLCNAVTKRGTYCTLRAGWATDHFGAGRCKMHGGAVRSKHGLYSKTFKGRPSLQERFEAKLQDPDLSQVKRQAAWGEVIFDEWIERQEEHLRLIDQHWSTLVKASDEILAADTPESLMAARAKLKELREQISTGAKGVPDTLAGYKILGTITKAKDAWKRSDSLGAVTVQDFQRFQNAVVHVVANLTKDLFPAETDHSEFCRKLQEAIGKLPV